MSPPIAIVGRGCVLPGALDPDALWRLVIEGRSAIDAAPPGRWRLSPERALTSDPKRAIDRAWSDRGGYVRGFEAVFDPGGFAIDAASIAGLDPIYRWTLHAAREALREAGAPPRHAGVILGNLSFPTASHAALAERHWLRGVVDRPAVDPRERFHSSMVASLVARALELGGAPSFCLDAACASSLYAIALACEALADGRADLMLAGAVNCTDDLFIHVGFSALDALSKSGRSRPFHPEADGLVPAEGAAVLALVRLEDALRDGRRVLGVIRGVGLANDGRGPSFLAPAEEGQVRAMRAAYARAGVSPGEIGWIECHATGTPLGDATEVRSTSRVFAGCEGVPIGSLKANLGHLVTTAGAAGLLKVLGAFEAGVLPPTPHLDRVSRVLEKSPLRVVTEPEPWAQRVRRAAVSAFGFGGNDAHLIVEQHASGRTYSFAAPELSRGEEPIAIVGIGARVGPFGSARALADALSTGAGGRRAETVTLPLEHLRTPPSDLERALAQQTMLLAAALDARIEELDPERTAVLVGMQCDPEVARYGVRWRLPELAPEHEAGRDAFAPRLTAAGVLGTMPNIPANRLNRELDLRGPSYTISAAELSGIRALEIAVRALRRGELEAAIVGAVDLSCEPVHEETARALLPGALARGGDAAVVLVLMRASDARARGLPVLAFVENEASDGALRLGPRVEGGSLAPRFGHAQAASGLLHVAAAALCLHRRARPGERPGAWASDGPRRARVEVESMDGEVAVVALREDVHTPDGAFALDAIVSAHPLVLAAHPPPPRLDVAEEGELLDPAPALPPPPPACGPVPASEEEAMLPPAPALPPVLGESEARAPAAATAEASARASSRSVRAAVAAPSVEAAAFEAAAIAPI
ncbi:MAG TPA: beta-ketoacyl synthase N-terminal-like domain-containing protein, partial [Sandaracinaceae bacterium]